VQISQQLTKIPQSVTIAQADRIRKLRAEGKQVIALQTGDPDFSTPRPIITAAHEAMQQGYTHYAASRGLPELREALSHKLARDNSVDYDPETEILVTNGGVHAYFCALQAILNDGDEVLVPDPSWMTHANVVTLLGKVTKRVPARPEHGFWPQRDDWEKSVSAKTVALVVNSPSNPTGAVASADYLERLVLFAASHNLYVISDEVYEAILFDGRSHVCVAALPEARERTLLVNSFSKTYAMTGWRLGYLAASAPVISQALKASQHTVTNPAPFTQRAAVRALTDPEVAAAVRQMAATYERRRDLAVGLLEANKPAGIGMIQPQGAFYLFLDVRHLEPSSIKAVDELLENYQVSLVPGVAFGPSGEGFVRMTFAASEADIEEGLKRILKWAEDKS
jgi:aspartate/methionine/tyrosine aminotransferase